MYMRITRGILLLAFAATIAGCKVPAARTGIPVAHNLPPANMLMEPGPGVGGPGPGVLAPGPLGPGHAMMGGGAMMGADVAAAPQNVQVKFDKPAGMHVQWDVSAPGAYDSAALISPGRQNFAQGGVFRLKLTSIPGREGLELYPTLEVGPASTRTAAYIAHSAVPIQFTEEDFDQVTAGNFVFTGETSMDIDGAGNAELQLRERRTGHQAGRDERRAPQENLLHTSTSKWIWPTGP